MSVSRPLAAVVAAVATVAVSACSVPSTNFSAETNRAYDAAKGVNSRDTPVQIHNALLIDHRPQEVDAADDAESTSATVSAALVNKTEQAVTLTGVSAETFDGEPLTTQFAGDSGSIGLGPSVGADSDRRALVLDATDAEVVVELDDLTAGSNITLTFEFEGVEDVVLTDVPILSIEDPIFADVDISDPSEDEESDEADEEDAPTEDEAEEEAQVAP